jgi:hypothetical protein
LLKVIFLFKDGSKLSVEVESFNVKRNLLGELAGVSWKNAERKPKLIHLNIDEILAITTEETE